MSITQVMPPPVQPENEEIIVRLVDIIEFLKRSRWKLLVGAVLGLVVGAMYAFSKPNMYTAQVTVMPEIQAKGAGNLGNLGSLAGLAGINLDNLNAQDAIRPDLYPTILQSVPFALDLLKQPVYSQKLKAQMPLQEFIDRTGGDSFFNRILKVFGGERNADNVDERADPGNFSQAIQVTKEQDELIESVHASTSATYDKKTGIITVVGTEPDPVVAATVARLSLEYLTNYITTYRTEKSRKQVSFLDQQVREAKGRYQSAEFALSSYRDRNRNLYLETAKISEQRLQADYLLTQSVYGELSKQLEQAKIKVQEETPVFKILEPPTVPRRKSGPKRTLIMAGFTVAGAFLTMAFLLVRLILRTHSTQAI